MDISKEIAGYARNTGRSEENIVGWNRDYVRGIIELYKETKDSKIFFEQALEPMNDIFVGCPNEMPVLSVYGHLIYRLSDFLPKVEREKIRDYPDENGKILSDGVRWSSLEDWRSFWGERFGPVPTLLEILGTKCLVEASDLKGLPNYKLEDETT